MPTHHSYWLSSQILGLDICHLYFLIPNTEKAYIWIDEYTDFELWEIPTHGICIRGKESLINIWLQINESNLNFTGVKQWKNKRKTNS